MAAAEPAAPVALVIQTRISDEGVGAYVVWQRRIGEMLASHEGFLDQEVFAPSPPGRVDWIVVQRFASMRDAQLWMASDELAKLLEQIRPYFVGHDDIFLRTDATSEKLPVTATISCRVAPGDEAAFLQWETRAFEAEAKAPGFLGHRLERPVPGIQEKWGILLTFDSDENLKKWLNSPERDGLLEAGKNFQSDLSVRTSSVGFDFWARQAASRPPSKLWIMKTNLLVLLVLYPIVFLWGYFVSDPLFASKGMPVWAWLFLGNLFSTQVMGWWVVPWAFRMYDSWLGDTPSPWHEVLGWVTVLGFFASSMALYAFLLTRHPMHYF